MKLKNLINYLFENVDEAAIRGFSLDILKKKMPEFEKRQNPEDFYSVNGARYYGDGLPGDGSVVGLIKSLRNQNKS